MTRASARLCSLATLLLAGLLIATPWAAGGKSQAGQVSLVLLLALAGVIRLAQAGSGPRRAPSRWLCLVGALVGASALHTMHPDRTVQSLLLLLAYLLAAALAAQGVREIPWTGRALLGSISAAGVLVSCEGIYQLLRGGQGGLYARVLTGPFGYPNAAGGFLVLTTAAALAVAREDLDARLQRAAWAAASVSVLGLVLTRSQGALLAACIGLAVWATLDQAVWRSRPWVWAGAGALGLVLLIAFARTSLLSLPLRLATLFRAGPTDPSYLWRLHILQWTWAMVQDHPWWGVGPGAFPVALSHYQSIPYVSGQNPHNLYMEIAAEYGLPVAILMILALGTYLWRLAAATRRASATDCVRGRLAVLLAALAAFFVHSLVDLDWSFPAIATAAAIILGLASVHLPPRIPARTHGRAPWKAAAFLLLLGMAFLSVSRYYASALVGWAQLALADRRPARARQEAAWALRLNPTSFPAHQVMAWARLLGGEPLAAAEVALRAVRTVPLDPNTHYLAGEIAAGSGRWSLALEHFRAAVDLAPYAQLRFHGGLVESAVKAGVGAEARLRYERAAAIFTEERVLNPEARCLVPGDRYLLARMSRIAAVSFGDAGETSRQRAATELAQRLEQPDLRGICVSRGRPGQTSPEAAIASFWRALADGGWPRAEQFLTPGLLLSLPREDLARWQGGDSARPVHLAWIAALSGGESSANIRFQVEIDTGPASRASRCAQATARTIGDSWFLDSLPIIESAPCRP